MINLCLIKQKIYYLAELLFTRALVGTLVRNIEIILENILYSLCNAMMANF